jgi:predicted nucleic acid-binding protein
MPGSRFAISTPYMPADGDTRGTNCMNAVDTNVFVYFVDRDEPLKRGKAVELLDRLAKDDVETVLLWQVAAEFLSCLRRWENEGRINRQEVQGNFDRLEALFRCVSPTQPVFRKSFDLCSRYSLSHRDAMLLAACIEAGVRTLYSEDLSSGAQYDSVTVVNPFA